MQKIIMTNKDFSDPHFLLLEIQKLAQELGVILATPNNPGLYALKAKLRSLENQKWQGEIYNRQYSDHEVYLAMHEACRVTLDIVSNSFDRHLMSQRIVSND